MSEQWTDEKIRGEFSADAYGAPSVNQLMRENYDGDGEMVVDRDEAIATAIRMRDEMQARITELEAQVERLEAAADPEALVIVYGKGRVDEQKRSRKRIAELEAQLAAARRWEPVSHTELATCSCGNCTNQWEIEGDTLITLYDREDKCTVSVVLPDNLRLCRVAGEGTNGN